MKIFYRFISIEQVTLDGSMLWSGAVRKSLWHHLKLLSKSMALKLDCWQAMGLLVSWRSAVLPKNICFLSLISVLMIFFILFFIKKFRYMMLGTWYLWISQRLLWRCWRGGWIVHSPNPPMMNLPYWFPQCDCNEIVFVNKFRLVELMIG